MLTNLKGEVSFCRAYVVITFFITWLEFVKFSCTHKDWKLNSMLMKTYNKGSLQLT